MKIKLILFSCVLVLLNAFAIPSGAEASEAQWAESFNAGDIWPGFEAQDQTGTEWSGPKGQATLYLFNRSVVW